MPTNEAYVHQYFEQPPRSHLAAKHHPHHHHEGVEDVEGQSLHSASSSRPDDKKVLTTLLLTGLMYSFTVGGAYGIEESVLGGGPFLTIVSIILIPVLMALPTALVVAELASAIPSNAGYLMWANLCFHRVAYLALVLLSLFHIFLDNALYPVLFSEYACTAMSCSRAGQVGLRVAMLAVIYVLNILGIEAVGIASVVFTCFSVTPFFLMLLIHLFTTGFYMNWPALATVPRNIKWATFFTTASWNLSGIEQAGTVAEDVKDPQHTFTNSLLPLVGLAIMTYLPPVLVGASATTGPIDLTEWQTGFWAEVSYRVGGSPLKAIIVLGSIVSAFGLTLSALCTTSNIVAGMALTEAFPGKLGELLCRRHHRFGTYHWAITANTVLTAVFSMLFDFQSLVMIGQFFYSIRMLCVFVSFLLIRRLFPHLHRPYRMPVAGVKMGAMMGVAMVLYTVLMLIAISQEWLSAVVSLSLLAACVVLAWYYCTFVRSRDFLGRIVTVMVEDDQNSS